MSKANMLRTLAIIIREASHLIYQVTMLKAGAVSRSYYLSQRLDSIIKMATKLRAKTI